MKKPGTVIRRITVSGFFCYVRLAAHVANGCESRLRPVVGRISPKARVPTVRWDLKEAGCGNRLTTGKPLA